MIILLIIAGLLLASFVIWLFIPPTKAQLEEEEHNRLLGDPEKDHDFQD